MDRRTAFTLAGLLPVAAALASPEHPACAPPAELRSVLASLAFEADDCRPGRDCWSEKMDRIEALLRAHPEDVHVHRLYQDAKRSAGGWLPESIEPLREEYSRRLMERPGEDAAQYLYGRLLSFEEAILHYRRALELDPDFAPGHLALAQALGVVSRDAGDASYREPEIHEHFETFLRLCPSSFQEPLRYSSIVADEGFWRERLPGLRSAVETAPAEEAVLALPHLWRLEFGAVPVEQHPAVRERIRGDLRRLRAQELLGSYAWLQALRSGSELAGDEKEVAEVNAGLVAAFPCSDTAEELTRREMEARHGSDWTQLPRERLQEILRELDGRIEACPDQFSFQLTRFHMLSQVSDLSEERILDEVERFLVAWERNVAFLRMDPSPYARVARFLLERGVAIERVPILVMKDQELAEATWADRERSTGPPEVKQRMRAGRISGDLLRFALLAEAHIRLGEISEAKSALDALRERVSDFEALPPSMPEKLERQKATYSLLRGDLARKEGRLQDALAFYLEARGYRPGEGEEGEKRAREVWKELGGTDEGWDALAGKADRGVVQALAPTRWLETNEELEDFELKDLTGKVWRKADLLGKTVLINLWATWCPPCVAELLYLQKLFERVSGEPNVVILTFNLDENRGLVAPFTESHGLSLPVLFATEHVLSRQRRMSIPETWIVDAEGRIRTKQTGFPLREGENWVEEAVQAIEEVRAR